MILRHVTNELPLTSYHHQISGGTIAYIHYSSNNVKTKCQDEEGQVNVACVKQEEYDSIGRDHKKDFIGHGSGILFLPGFQSTMRSTKSKALFDLCVETSTEFTTLDYYGHGESSCGSNKSEGNNDRNLLKGGTISRWTEDVLTILDNVTTSPRQILVGSSMGAWIMILIALARMDRIGGLVGIAAAPDFTNLLSQQINADPLLSNQMNDLDYADIPTSYDENGTYRIFRELLNDGQNNFILSNGKNSIDFKDGNFPIVLIHGTKDQDIPAEYSKKILLKSINAKEKRLILVEDGDHRLSSSENITVILETVKKVLNSLQ